MDHEPLQLRLGKGEVIDIKARSNSISDPYQVPRLSKWSIGKLELNEEQEAVFTQYGSAPSIAAKEQLVLLIRKGKKNSDGLKVVLMDGGGDFFGGGEFFFMNAAKSSITHDNNLIAV